MIPSYVYIHILAAIWGSFLNVVAHRLLIGESIVRPRSRCPFCKTTIAWYDNIPILSWLVLQGKCRTCKKSISFLYPLIEVLTIISFGLLYYYNPTHFFSHALFFSALIVTVRTDLEYMLISRLATLGMIPFAWICSFAGLLPIDLKESILGACVGYLSLWVVARIFYAATKKHGLGEGDFDLLALIGAFCGPQGVLISLLIGSWFGTAISLMYIVACKKNLQVKIPFGPFLAFGAMSYVIWQSHIEQLLNLYL